MEEKRERSALEKHIRYFGGPHGVSYSSMVTQNEKIGLSWWEARQTAAVVSAGAGAKVSGCPFAMFKPKQAVGVLNHPQSTGIYNLDGSINEERWEELLPYASQNDSNESIITEHNLYQFLEDCRKKDPRPDPLGLAKVASNGEWETFLRVFATRDQQGVRFVPIKRLRDFFEDSQIPGKEVEESISKTL